MLASKLFVFIKVREITTMITMDSIEDECTFPSFNYMKSKIKNKLQEHLKQTMRMYSENFHNLKTFPFQDAITKWKLVKT